MVFKVLRLFGLCLVCALCVCALADKPMPKSIELNFYEIEIDLSAQSEFTLVASVTPEGANDNFTWWSTDTDVVTVDSGRVVCLRPGSATVYVRVHGNQNVRAGCAVTVTDSRAPERIIAYPSQISAEPGSSIKLECLVMPQGAGTGLVYSSSNTYVATVSEDGRVSVLNEGHATLTVSSAYSPDIKTEIKLNAAYGERIKSLRAGESSLKLEKGQKVRLDIKTEPAGATGALIFESADESVATVDPDGVVTAVGYGSTEISVTTYRDPNVGTGVPVSVSDRDRPESIDWSASGELLLAPGESLLLSVSLEPKSAVTDYSVSSSREDIVSVEGDTLTAHKRGIAHITIQSAYREDLEARFTVTVEDGTLRLQMPLRRTDVSGIDENLGRIQNVKNCALSELKELYDTGAMGKKEYERRVSTVESAFEMYAFPWTVTDTDKYWKAENSENGAKDFKPGTVYYGLPYISGESTNRTYNVKRALEQQRYLSVEGENYYVLNGEFEGYAGNDCSAFVARALWGVTVIDGDKTGDLYYDQRLSKFDDPAQLRAGDLLVRHSAHVVMFLYWADEAHTQAVFIQQGGSEPGINTVNTIVEEVSLYTEDSYRLRRLKEF